MLYVFHGHRFWVKRKLDSLLVSAREKGRVIAHISAEGDEPLSRYLARDLFSQKFCIWSEGMLALPSREAELKDLIPSLVATNDIFIFLEEEISKTWEKIFGKSGVKVEEIKTPPPPKLLAWAETEAKKLDLNLGASELKAVIGETENDPWVISALLLRQSAEKTVRSRTSNSLGKPAVFSAKEPNYFYFADAVSAKDTPRAIRLIREYIKNGFGVEEAFWKLWWKIKTLRMAEAGLSAADAGIHPFVAKKAAEDLSRWRKGELRKYSGSLQDLFSEVRRGEKDFEEGLLPLLLGERP